MQNLFHVWPQVVLLVYAVLGSVAALRLLSRRRAYMVLAEVALVLLVLHAGGFFTVLGL